MFILNYIEGGNPFVGIFESEKDAFSSAVKLVTAICKDDDINFEAPVKTTEADFKKSGRSADFDGEKTFYYSPATHRYFVIQKVSVGKNYRLL